jgi:hypothetical protein
MTRWFRIAIPCAALLSSTALAGEYSGTFAGAAGTLTLTQRGARVTGEGTVEGLAGRLDGALQGEFVVGTYSTDDGQGFFQAALQDGQLLVSFDGDAPLRFARRGQAPARAAHADPTAPPAEGPTATAPAAAGPAPRAATGARHRAELDGYELRAPAGWKLVDKGGRLLLGSDVEAGLIVAWYAPGLGLVELQQHARRGLDEDGVALRPLGEARGLKVAGGQALAVDLGGQGADGVALQARAVGVVGPRGSVVVVGLTTPDKLAGLGGRVEQVAAAVRFFEPKVPKGNHLLRGALCHWSGGGGGSSTRRMSFDGQGRVAWGSEFAASGRFTDSGGQQTGSWGAMSGNQYDPASVGSYAVDGDRVRIRWPGETQDCSVHFRQADGRISELKCGERVYGAGLCE